MSANRVRVWVARVLSARFSAAAALMVAIALALTAALSGCQGCRGGPKPNNADAASNVPSVRIYVVSDLAGALEPCGCSKDQLGGLDHLAAFIRSTQVVMIAVLPTVYLSQHLEQSGPRLNQLK